MQEGIPLMLHLLWAAVFERGDAIQFHSSPVFNLTMKMPKRVVPISLFLLITWSLSPSVNLQMSRNASMPKTHLSLNFVLVLHESQHASSS